MTESICSCIRGKDGFDFYVFVKDRNSIIYHDLSDWMDEGGYTVPTTYEVDVIPPGRYNAVTLTMNVGTVTEISAEQLGGCLIDGAYCFQTEYCGYKYTKSRALFPYLECCLKKALATQEDPNKIMKIKEYLRLADINIELNNVKIGEKNLKIAKTLLGNIQCNCDCK